MSVDRNPSVQDIKICLLESERLYDKELMWSLSALEMPFGKYKGQTLDRVPLRYLDETVSVMPATWFVRTVWKFVDLAMMHPMVAGGAELARVPDMVLFDAEEEWESAHENTREHDDGT